MKTENTNGLRQHLEAVLFGRSKPVFTNEEISKILCSFNDYEYLKATERKMYVLLEALKESEGVVEWALDNGAEPTLVRLLGSIRMAVALAEGKGE